MDLESLLDAMGKGKTRGYSEKVSQEGIEFFNQYAMKGVGGEYLVYKFSIDSSKMDAIDDYGDFEERRVFEDFDAAMEFFRKAGADIEKFSAFKGISPL